MRELTSHKVNGCNDGLTIKVMDEPGPGNACHWYSVRGPEKQVLGIGMVPSFQHDVRFQNGPLKEAGINGTTHEVLLAIIEDRLVGFQSGPYACEENQQALNHVRAAQAVLKSRTEKRIARGVEGTHTV